MHISSGQIQAQGQHYFKHTEQQVHLRQRLATAPSTPTPKSKATPADTNPTTTNTEDTVDSELDVQTSLLKYLVEAMTGRSINLMNMAQVESAGDVNANPSTTTQPSGDNAPVLRVDATQVNEVETTQAAFSGQLNTSDGAEISVNLQYSLQRSYSATTVSASVSSGKAKDPLILNFNGTGVALDPGGTQFDLNSDNQVDMLPTLRAGSAYLALDRNGDGAINNGSELFGPQNGNGFAELAKFDVDSNNFIDDADPVFKRLQLFRPGETTQTLADKNVGAIYLGNVESPARLTDSNNQSLGQLRATGFYLTNAGTTGLVQQVDLVT